MTPWNAYTKRERKGQYENLYGGYDTPGRGAIAVELYAPEKMTDLDSTDEATDIRYRVWMKGEYRILTPAEVEKMKKIWDNK